MEIQNMFPSLAKHIKNRYEINGVPVGIKTEDAEDAIKKCKSVLRLYNQGQQIFPSDIKGIYAATVAEFENDKAQAAKTNLPSNPSAKVPATVSAAANAMLGNMPTVQTQNPQSVHTN